MLKIHKKKKKNNRNTLNALNKRRVYRGFRRNARRRVKHPDSRKRQKKTIEPPHVGATVIAMYDSCD